LTFNAYPILRPSYLLLTTSPLLRQTSPLFLADITAARTALHGLCRTLGSGNSEADEENEEDYIIIYNSGRASGCSRFHKHMQVLPRPPRTAFTLWPDRPPDDSVNVPYMYDLIRHPPSPAPSAADGPDVADHILTRYTASLDRFRARLGCQDDEPVPHNVVMTREWTVVIPRRTARIGGISANAAGMMGMVWVATEAELQEWKRRGPWSVLGELGRKADDTQT
jgi:ATP adenylyltransferase/5',5'''-P-1,P-4-tetraphosphate phosphorylase II